MLIPLLVDSSCLFLKTLIFAQKMRLISTAQFVGTADWPSFLSLISQTIAIGTYCVWVCNKLGIWKRILRQNNKRFVGPSNVSVYIVLSKFIVIYLWCLILSVFVFTTSLIVGVLIYIPGLIEVLISE